MKWWVWLLVAGAVFVIVKRSRAQLLANNRLIVGSVTHPDYAGSVMIDSGQGYSYSINPTQNPNAFDANGNVVGLAPGARVVGAKV